MKNMIQLEKITQKEVPIMTPLQTFYEAEAASIIKHLERRGMEGY